MRRRTSSTRTLRPITMALPAGICAGAPWASKSRWTCLPITRVCALRGCCAAGRVGVLPDAAHLSIFLGLRYPGARYQSRGPKLIDGGACTSRPPSWSTWRSSAVFPAVGLPRCLLSCAGRFMRTTSAPRVVVGGLVRASLLPASTGYWRRGASLGPMVAHRFVQSEATNILLLNHPRAGYSGGAPAGHWDSDRRSALVRR